MWFPVEVADQLALIGIIATVVLGLGAIAATIYVFRKQSPRREFTYSVEAAPLVSTQVRGLDKLSVAFGGTPLEHPYLVTVRVASTGRADISSSKFDGNKPILFDLNVPVLSEIDQTASSETVGARLTFQRSQSVIELQPSLLPKGFSLSGSYLCDGEPNVVPRIELADISIRNQFRTVASAEIRYARLALIAALLGAFIAGIATLGFLALVQRQVP